MQDNNDILVSVVMPCYNSEKTILYSIDSVKKQTHKNWELLIVDDCSNDRSTFVVESAIKDDPRIKLFKLYKNSGASIARNKAIKEAKGKYIAFLDSDDEWEENKIEKQVCYMEDNDVFFSYTNYRTILDNGETKVITSPKHITYKTMLKRNWIGCLTVMYNREAVGLIQIPKLDKRNDYALWLLILKKINDGYLLDDTLARYKDHQGISSGSKFKLIKYHYQMFNRVLKMNPIESCYRTIINIFYYVFSQKENK